MADSTINELVSLDSVANNDELVLWDTSASGTKKATVSNVVTPVATSVATSAINALDVASVGGSGKYISAISETNGKILATVSNIDTTVTSGSSNPVTSNAVYDYIFASLNLKPVTDSHPAKLTSFNFDLGINSTYRRSYILLCDITALNGVSSGGDSYGFVGLLLGHRAGGNLREHVSSFIITASYSEANTLGNALQLYTNDSIYVPVKVHNESTGKTYLAIRYGYGNETSITLVGTTQNMTGSFTIKHVDATTNIDSDGVTWTEKCVGLANMLNVNNSSTANNTAVTSNKIRTSTPSSPSSGDIWIA